MKSTDTKPDLGLKVDAKTESRNAEMVKVKGKKMPAAISLWLIINTTMCMSKCKVHYSLVEQEFNQYSICSVNIITVSIMCYNMGSIL